VNGIDLKLTTKYVLILNLSSKNLTLLLVISTITLLKHGSIRLCFNLSSFIGDFYHDQLIRASRYEFSLISFILFL